MKKFITCLAVITIMLFGFVNNAWAGDATNGAKIFSANCAACHMNGRNVVNGAKTLQKADLEKYSMLTSEAIIAQVTKGKAAMPAFATKLTATQIEDVASYVLAKAEKGW